VLEADGQVVVGVASRAAEGLRLVRETRPDVVLVDVQLGDESGLEVVAALAADTDRSSIVILMSAAEEAEVFDLAGADLADGFLPKAQLTGRAVRDLTARARQG